MDDSKLLHLTNIKVKRTRLGELMSRSCSGLPGELEDSSSVSSVHMFSGLNNLWGDEEEVLNTSHVLPSRGLPRVLKQSSKPKGDIYHQRGHKSNNNKKKSDKKRRGGNLAEDNEDNLMFGGLSGVLSAGGGRYPVSRSSESLKKPTLSNFNESEHEQFSRLNKKTLKQLPKTKAKDIPKRLKSLENQFLGEQKYLQQSQVLDNLKTMSDIEQFVNDMPLEYAYSVPQLRHYALQRACNSLSLPAKNKVKRLLTMAMKRWKHFDEQMLIKLREEQLNMKLNDKQVGFLIIAKQLNTLVMKQLKKYFKVWDFQYASKYDGIRNKRFNDSAYLIQYWYSQRLVLRRQPFKDPIGIFKMCLHRRHAIYQMITFEQKRKKAVEKIRRGVANRRRYYFAARIIQRIMRFVLIYREMKFRLTRSINRRFIQRWRRKVMRRTKKGILIIKLVLRLGGYTRVRGRIIERFTIPGSLHRSVEEAVSAIQRAYLSSCGRYEEYLRLKAERMKQERAEKKHKAIVTIQRFYWRRLHREIMRCAVLHNRARLIQRSFRHYQFRAPIKPHVPILQTCRERYYIYRIQRFMRRVQFMKRLWPRFPIRKRMIKCRKILRRMSAKKIQQCYRDHVIYVLKKKEEMRLHFNKLRESNDVFLNSLRTIQRNFRHSRRPYSQLPRHVRLFALGLWRKWWLRRWTAAGKIQRAAQAFMHHKRVKWDLLRIASVNKIWRLSKSYFLRNWVFDLIMTSRRRKAGASMKIQYNLRMFVWLKALKERFLVMKERIRITRLRNRCATIIQRFYRRVDEWYMYPIRVASRVMIKKRREEEYQRRVDMLLADSIKPIVRLFERNAKWQRFLRRTEQIRIAILKNKMSKRLQRMVRHFLVRVRVGHCIRIRAENLEAERLRKLHKWACGIIGKYVRRRKELFALYKRFQLRKQVIEENNRLTAAKLQALKEREEALEEVKQSEENMEATIRASWKQGSDVSGRNYYYNYVTGESQWEAPPDWEIKPVDAWIRNINDRGQVYYFNQQTDESRWLPPCVECGGEAERWCKDCCLSYCAPHYESLHDQEGGDPEMANHNWAVAELEKDSLKPGEVYCIECKRRACTRVCTVCWDNYCDYCFKYVHHVGDLKKHDSIPFRKAKRGWNTVKPRSKDEKIYYVNGTTGETTYDKPRELMNPQELVYFDNFVNHKKAAEDHVKRIDELQHEVESLKYERDMRLANDVNKIGGSNPNANKDKKKADGASTLDSVKSAKAGPLAFLTGISKAYKSKLLNPEERTRGQNRSDYIKSLLVNPDTT